MTPWRIAIGVACLAFLLCGLLAGVEVAKHADVKYLQGERVTLTQTVSQPGQTQVVTHQVTTRVTEPVTITTVNTVHKPPVTHTVTTTQTETVTETVTTTGTTGP